MYKKVVLLSLLFAGLFFSLDKVFNTSSSALPPDPAVHIKEVFELLKNDDVKGFDDLVFPEVVIRGMKKEILNEFVLSNPDVNEILNDLLSEPTKVSEFEMIGKLRENFLDDFKDIIKDGEQEGLDWKNTELLGYTWKLVGNSESPYEFKCNSKIYVKSGVHTFCIKYKNLLFLNGKWFAGRLMEIERITGDYYYMPDMYRAPAIEEYIDYPIFDSSSVIEVPLYEMEVMSEEAMEED